MGKLISILMFFGFIKPPMYRIIEAPISASEAIHPSIIACYGGYYHIDEKFIVQKWDSYCRRYINVTKRMTPDGVDRFISNKDNEK